MSLAMKWRIGLCAFVMAGTALAATPPAAEAPPLALAETGFSLKMPKAEAVPYSGMVSYDQAGSAGGAMMYPAPGLAGLLVAVVAHGVIAETSKNAEKTRLQAAANKVLDPYRAGLANFAHRELMAQALTKLGGPGEKTLIGAEAVPSTEWVVESVPQFILTQDQTALILEHAVTVYAAGAPAVVRYQNLIRVVSDGRAVPSSALAAAPAASSASAAEAQDPAVVAAAAAQVESLKQESVALYAHSLKVALEALAKGPSPAGTEVHKTFRYPEGTVQKMERGQLLSESCNRRVIKTLRGWLMSIPATERMDCSTASP